MARAARCSEIRSWRLKTRLWLGGSNHGPDGTRGVSTLRLDALAGQRSLYCTRIYSAAYRMYHAMVILAQREVAQVPCSFLCVMLSSFSGVNSVRTVHIQSSHNSTWLFICMHSSTRLYSGGFPQLIPYVYALAAALALPLLLLSPLLLPPPAWHGPFAGGFAS